MPCSTQAPRAFWSMWWRSIKKPLDLNCKKKRWIPVSFWPQSITRKDANSIVLHQAPLTLLRLLQVSPTDVMKVYTTFIHSASITRGVTYAKLTHTVAEGRYTTAPHLFPQAALIMIMIMIMMMIPTWTWTLPRVRGHSLSLRRLGPSLHHTALRHSLASLDTRL